MSADGAATNTPVKYSAPEIKQAPANARLSSVKGRSLVVDALVFVLPGFKALIL